MKKISLVGKFRYLGNILIVMQGILLVLLAIFFVNRQYSETWQNYPGQEESVAVYLKNISPTKEGEVSNYLFNVADEQSLFIVRKDSSLKDDGEFSGFKIGVYGNVEKNDVSLEFLNQRILDTQNLRMLLESKNENSTLGIDRGSVDSLGDIPYFRFYERTVVKQLSQLIGDSGTVHGTYYIMGLNSEDQKAEFISGLTSSSGLSQAALLSKTSGESQDDSFKRDILLAFIIAQVFLNSVFFLVLAVKSLHKQGRLALLGWSRKAFVWSVFGNFLMTSIIQIPFLILLGYLLAGWNEFSPMLVSYFAMVLLINFIFVAVELMIASAVILMTKSLDAIYGRIPKKVLYAFGIFAYLLVSVGVVFCGSYVDGPMKMLSDNMKLSKKWAQVSDYQILRSISVGEDGSAFSGQSNKMDQDIYDWYSSIAHNKGVYLINTTYFDRNILETWAENQLYSQIPTKPFWYFTASPNYVSDLGVELSEDVRREAEAGVRIYLLPDTLSGTERTKMEGWLKEDSVGGIGSGDIQTQFTKDREFKFVTYKPEKELFTWGTNSKDAVVEMGPVMYLCTPQNMKYFEVESLKATGVNGYMKFIDEQTKNKYTKNKLFDQYNLSDNKPTFVEVQQYIDGLQKDIGLTILWFGLVFVILLVILVGLLLTLTSIFRLANQEKINVKKFLGFGFCHIYGTPMILLGGILILEIGIMAVLQSKFGLLLMVIVSVIQIFIFVKYMANSELKRLLTSLKGE